MAPQQSPCPLPHCARHPLLAALLPPARWSVLAQAAPVAVPDAQDWARSRPPSARRARPRSGASSTRPRRPERKAFRQQLRQQIEALTPAQRQALIQQTRKGWYNLSTDERQRLIDERREQIETMSPAERRELLRQRREMLRRPGPEEPRRLRDRLPPVDPCATLPASGALGRSISSLGQWVGQALGGRGRQPPAADPGRWVAGRPRRRPGQRQRAGAPLKPPGLRPPCSCWGRREDAEDMVQGGLSAPVALRAPATRMAPAWRPTSTPSSSTAAKAGWRAGAS